MKLDDLLTQLARDPAIPHDLAEISLLLARDEFPFLDVDAYLAELTAMAREIAREAKGHPSHRVQVLCRYLFHEMGYRGNVTNYYDPANSFLNLVMDRRFGIPITLSVLTIAVGSRAGMDVLGIGLPGHFIVQARHPGGKVLIDPFHGGRILSHADCENLVRHATGHAITLSDDALQPVPPGRIVERILNNLRSIYLKQEDWPRATRVLTRLRQVSPDNALVQRDLGLSLLHGSQPGKALEQLQAYLDAAPDADDAEAIKQSIRQAWRDVASRN